MTWIADVAHVAFFGIPFDVRLSAAARVTPLAALGVPTPRRRPRRLERALAAHGEAAAGGRSDRGQRAARRPHGAGRKPVRCRRRPWSPTAAAPRSGWSPAMRRSARRSLRASASRLRLRRQDLRMLVGCGAGGAIAGAFGAPLTGAFYASELIIGAYSLANAGADLRRLARRLADHQGADRRALCDRRAARRVADGAPPSRARRARADLGGDRRRLDARRRAGRARLQGEPAARLDRSRRSAVWRSARWRS